MRIFGLKSFPKPFVRKKTEFEEAAILTPLLIESLSAGAAEFWFSAKFPFSLLNSLEIEFSIFPLFKGTSPTDNAFSSFCWFSEWLEVNFPLKLLVDLLIFLYSGIFIWGWWWELVAVVVDDVMLWLRTFFLKEKVWENNFKISQGPRSKHKNGGMKSWCIRT